MSVNDRQKKNIDTKKKKKGFFPGNSVTWQSMNAGCTRGLCISNHSGDKNPRDNLGGTDTALSTAYP